MTTQIMMVMKVFSIKIWALITVMHEGDFFFFPKYTSLSLSILEMFICGFEYEMSIFIGQLYNTSSCFNLFRYRVCTFVPSNFVQRKSFGSLY